MLTLNPGYYCLVEQHCSARQLLTTGFCNFEKGDDDPVGGKVRVVKEDEHTLGFANSLHRDTCDLILKLLVAEYIDLIVNEINHCRKYSRKTKRTLFCKVKEIDALIGLGLPITCAYNIVVGGLRMKKGCWLSAFFVIFDFAMILTHKLVHNFLGWSFVHCTALPIILSVDGSV